MAPQATATSRKKTEVGLPAFASITAADIVRAPTVQRSIPLDLLPLLKPFKKSGRLALRIERLPQRAKLSAGRRNSDASWSLASDELEALNYLPPSIIQAAHELTIRIMKFDEADIDNMIARGNMTDVIQHEMLHVVGLGTLWTSFSLVQGAGTPESRYTGTLGVGGCVALGGANVCPGSVPLETGGGAGTRDSHWSDAVFFNELMTGFVNTRQSVPTGILNPLSSMSIASLGDVGYTVNTKAADPYTIPGHSASSILGQLNVSESQPAWEQVHEPKFMITRSGKISIAKKQ